MCACKNSTSRARSVERLHLAARLQLAIKWAKMVIFNN